MQVPCIANPCPGPRGLLVACLLVAVSTSWRAVVAGTGEAFTLPLQGKKATSGLHILVDPQWVAGPGYRPVRLTVTSPVPAKADRTLRVEIFPNSYSRSYWYSETTAYVELPEGSRQVEITVYVPQRDRWHTLRIDTYEDGVLLEDLSMQRGQSWREPRSYESEASPMLLFVDADAPSPSGRKRVISAARLGSRGKDTFSLPDPRRLNFLLLDYDQESRKLADSAAQHRATDTETLDWVNNTSSIELLPPGNLPANPVGLSAIDVVFIPLEDLRTLAADHPDRMASLSRHIQTGASLIVYGGGDQFEGLPDVERLLGMRPDVISTGDSAWLAADPSDHGQKVSTYTAFLRQYGQAWIAPGSDVADDANEQKPAKPEESVPIEQRANVKLRDHGLGKVVVIDAQDPFQQEPLFWHWVFRTLGTNRWLWQKRHGMSLQSNNDDFWQFLIPGVGAAPVKSFLATIALFVIVIGPVNFFLLKRIKRLYLLPLTVPLAAAVTTVLMIFYALVSDGLSTRVRLRSFTHIDQPTDTSVCWSRQAYYAALTPSAGITFPSDSCVYPLEPFPSDSESRIRRRDEQDDDSQLRILSQGYLSSRTTSQFMVIRTSPAATGLTVSERPEGGIHVINRLGTLLQQLWITDSQGNLFVANDVAEGSQVRPRPAQPSSEEKHIAAVLLAGQSQLSEEFDKNLRNDFFGSIGRRYWIPGIGPPSCATSCLETNLQDARNFLPPRPKAYLAVTRQVPSAVPVGIDAREEASFHVIQGRW